MTWRLPLTCLLVSLIFAGALLPVIAGAEMIFERRSIRIDPAPPPAPKPGEEAAALPQREPVVIDAEIRSEEALKLENILALNTLTPDTGVMIVLTTPTIVALPFMQVFTPVDAVFIGEEGNIVQIIPGVIMGELNKSLGPNASYVKAILFLKEGQAKVRAIKPHDMVVAPMFTPPQAVQE